MPEDCKVKKDSMVPREIKGNQAFKEKRGAKESKVRLITLNMQLSADDCVMFLRHMPLPVGEAALPYMASVYRCIDLHPSEAQPWKTFLNHTFILTCHPNKSD